MAGCGWLEPRVAKRRVKCRSCGREIRKGERYFVYVYRDGPYRRREVCCVDCAKNTLEMIISCRVWMDRAAWHNSWGYEACVRSYGKERCRRYYVVIPQKLAEIAKLLGVDVEDLVKRIDPHAIPSIR